MEYNLVEGISELLQLLVLWANKKNVQKARQAATVLNLFARKGSHTRPEEYLSITLC